MKDCITASLPSRVSGFNPVVIAPWESQGILDKVLRQPGQLGAWVWVGWEFGQLLFTYRASQYFVT